MEEIWSKLRCPSYEGNLDIMYTGRLVRLLSNAKDVEKNIMRNEKKRGCGTNRMSNKLVLLCMLLGTILIVVVLPLAIYFESTPPPIGGVVGAYIGGIIFGLFLAIAWGSYLKNTDIGL